MRALLNGLTVALLSENQQIRAAWRALFDLEIGLAGAALTSTPDITIRAAVTEHLPEPPGQPPSYARPSGTGERPLQFYDMPNGGFLALVRPARIIFDFPQNTAHIYLTPQILDTRNLEDVTMIALAPLLRRRGFFMEHAFAASLGDTAVLLAGPSGSGKTTVGLALVLAGWGYLGNDVALLQENDGTVRSLPSPGAVNLAPDSIALLPGLRDRFPPLDRDQSPGKQSIARRTLLHESEFGQPAPVKLILFPALTTDQDWSLREAPAAIGFARLLAESVDQWDRDTHAPHFDLLAALSSQARFFMLDLPAGRTDILRKPAALFAGLIPI